MENVGFHFWVSFEKLKSNWNQTWVKDTLMVPLYVNEIKCIKVKGHQRSS